MEKENLPPFTFSCNDISPGSAIPVVWNMYLRTLRILYDKKLIEVDAGDSVSVYLVDMAEAIILKSAQRVQGNRSDKSEIDEAGLFEHALLDCSYMLENLTHDPYGRLE